MPFRCLLNELERDGGTGDFLKGYLHDVHAIPSQFCDSFQNPFNLVSCIYLLFEEEPQRDARLTKRPINTGQVIEYF